MSDIRDFDENHENKAAEDPCSTDAVKIEIRRLDRLETTERLSNPSGS
ncbi:hypothetical protein ABZU32_35250 [Sphaerisporangium sp. NPDC005288]